MGEISNVRRPMKSQLALEFIIVYSIVLVIFVIVFAVISNERSASLATQQASLMQLLAQNVAGYINQALQAGNGYSLTVPLGSGIGAASYNISISTTGFVFAKTTVGKQVISGEAVSSARDLVVNGTFIVGNGGVQLYQLPSYTNYITVSNVRGTIFVDGPAPSVSTLPGVPFVTQPASLEAPYFNGVNSVIVAQASNSLYFSNSITVDAWVYFNTIDTGPSSPYVSNPIVGEAGRASLPFMLSVANTGIPIFLMDWGTFSLSPSGGVAVKTLYNIAATYNGAVATLYLDGSPVASNSVSLSISAPSDLVIGGSPQNGTYTNGYIMGVQLYNTSLTQNQISLIYTSGPSSQPVNLAAAVGWWPLSGNSNDYSGHGNYGAAANIIYTYGVDTNAKLTTLGGTPAPGVPIGFVATGGLIGGTNSLSSYTNQLGYQSTLLAARGFSGTSPVQVESFNGNMSTIRNLIGWWPLNLGAIQSGNLYEGDYSGVSINGTFLNGTLGHIANRTNTLYGYFNGVNSTMETNALASSSSFTLAFWVNVSNEIKMTSADGYTLFNSTGSNNVQFWFDLGEPGGAPCGLGDEWLGIGSSAYPGLGINGSTWNFVAVSVNNGTASFYANGQGGCSFSVTPGPYSLDQFSVGTTSFGISPYQGGLSNLQVYGSALGAGQISRIYSQGMGGVPVANGNIIAWYPLSGSGTNYARPQNPFKQTSNEVSFQAAGFTGLTSQSNSSVFPIFDGMNSEVAFQSSVMPVKSYCNLTITAWAYDSGMPGALGGVFNFSGSNGQDSISMNDSSIGYEVGSGSDPDSWTVNPGYSLRGGWAFVTTRLSGGVAGGFLNGLPSGTPQSANVGCISVSNADFGFTGAAYMNGSIADIQVYNSSLSQLQIQQLYVQGIPDPIVLNTSFG